MLCIRHCYWNLIINCSTDKTPSPLYLSIVKVEILTRFLIHPLHTGRDNKILYLLCVMFWFSKLRIFAPHFQNKYLKWNKVWSKNPEHKHNLHLWEKVRISLSRPVYMINTEFLTVELAPGLQSVEIRNKLLDDPLLYILSRATFPGAPSYGGMRT